MFSLIHTHFSKLTCPSPLHPLPVCTSWRSSLWHPISQCGVYSADLQSNEEAMYEWSPASFWQLAIIRHPVTCLVGGEGPVEPMSSFSREWCSLPWSFPWPFLGKRWAYEWKRVRRKKRKFRSFQGLGEFREKGECQPEMPLPDLWAEKSYLRPLSIFLFSVLKVFFLLNFVDLRKNNHLRIYDVNSLGVEKVWLSSD